MEGSRTQLILVVDDDQKNLSLLTAILQPYGFKVITADSGQKAIEVFKEFRPDLILLDIMMPGMNGYQVCTEIRKLQGELHIPIIMVTALETIDDKERAELAGADDFISKPINRAELYLRIKSLLRISSYQKRLYRKKKEMERLVWELQREQKAKEELIHMIVHDLKNPLTGIVGNLELLRMRRDCLDEKQSLQVDKAMVACDRMMNMIQNILDVYRLSEGKLKPRLFKVELAGLIDESIELFRIAAQLKNITIESQIEGKKDIAVITDPDLLKRILGNLLSNAIRHSPEGGRITLKTALKDKTFTISVRDRGPGIPDEMKSRVFVPFEQLQQSRERQPVGSAGLGLTFSRMATETLGG
ncbi:MAG: hybrid sensor histidine kinase/response regulator, partial [Nitrospirae bacterium]